MLSLKEKETIEEQAFLCLPSLLSPVCNIYPLSIKEIVGIGLNRYNNLLGILLLTEVEIAEIVKEKMKIDIPLEEIRPLKYLIDSAANEDMFLLELQRAFSTFTKEDILILPKINSILIGPPEEKRLITEENFSKFQDILRVQNKRSIKEPPPENESAIAKKFRLKREARDAAKRKQQAKQGGEQSFLELMEIAEVFGIDYQNKSLFALYNLIQRHQAREKWNQDIQMICAGADSSKMKTKYWGGNLKEK